MDEEIKGMFKNCEDELAYLRDVFRKYQDKNKRKLSQQDIEARSKNIDLLRRNLNLLQDEFKDQVSRMRKDIAPVQASSNDFLDIFAINRNEDEDEERSLDEEERDILKQFEDNDKELEDIALQIVGSLDQLKGKAQNIQTTIARQSELLKKTNKKAEANEARLR